MIDVYSSRRRLGSKNVFQSLDLDLKFFPLLNVAFNWAFLSTNIVDDV